jgi:hypothetical protein
MALNDPNDPNKKPTDVAGQPLNTPAGQPTPSVAPVPAVPLAIGQQRVAQPQLYQRGTGFSGIKKIIGASQGSRLGEVVGGRLQQAGQNVRSDITTARQQFQTQAQQQQQQTQQQYTAAQNAMGAIALGGAPSGDMSNLAGSISPEQQQAFQALTSGEYKGPTGLTDTSQLQAKAMEAEELGQLAGSQYGRQQLLSQEFGQRGGYGAKQSALDALILGKTAGKQLAQAQSGLTGISQNLAQAEATAQETGKSLKQQQAGYGKQLMTGLEQQASDISRQVSERQAKYSELQKGEKEKLLKALETGEVSEEDKDIIEKLQKAGISEGTYLGGASRQDLQRFLEEEEGPTAASSISKSELARAKALQKLGGGAAADVLAPSLSRFEGKEKEAESYDPTKAIGFKKGDKDSQLVEELKTRGEESSKTYKESKETEDTNQAIADIVSKYKNNADNMSFGERNYLAQHGIYAVEGSHGNKVNWASGTPSRAAGEFSGSLNLIHPNDIISQHSQAAEAARTQRKESESKLSKVLKIKKKQSK